MPLYEYVCNDCEVRFDALVGSPSRADEMACRSCSGSNVRRLVSSFARVGGFDDTFAAMESTRPSAGGCCGGSCGCHH